jgi:hypothetical protein
MRFSLLFAHAKPSSKTLNDIAGVDSNDRETRKIEAWLEMAESREGDVEATLPFFLEIPTIVFQDEIIKFG